MIPLGKTHGTRQYGLFHIGLGSYFWWREVLGQRFTIAPITKHVQMCPWLMAAAAVPYCQIETQAIAVALQSLVVMPLMTVVGNGSIAEVVGGATDWIGFKKQGNLNLAKLELIVPLMHLNVWMGMCWLHNGEPFGRDGGRVAVPT